MTIQILGMGCPNCQKLESNAREAVKNLNLEATFEKVDSMEDIMAYGVTGTPALGVDKKILSKGKLLSVHQIEKLLKG